MGDDGENTQVEHSKKVGSWTNLDFKHLNEIKNVVLEAWDKKFEPQQLDPRRVSAAREKEANRAIENLKENPKFDKDNGENDGKKQSRAEQAIKALTDKPTEGTPVLEKRKFWKQLDPEVYRKIKEAIVGAEADINEKAKAQDKKMNLYYARKFCADGGDPKELIEEIKAQEDNPDNTETAQSGNQGNGDDTETATVAESQRESNAADNVEEQNSSQSDQKADDDQQRNNGPQDSSDTQQESDGNQGKNKDSQKGQNNQKSGTNQKGQSKSKSSSSSK